MFYESWEAMFVLLGLYLLSGPILGIAGVLRAGRALREAEALRREVARKRGFVIRDHSLVIHADCQRENCPGKKS